jgi:hypothetical protein
LEIMNEWATTNAMTGGEYMGGQAGGKWQGGGRGAVAVSPFRPYPHLSGGTVLG